MTKRLFSWLSLMAVFISFYSCRQELLPSEDQNSINKTKVEWMSKNQILKNPLLSSKLESLIKTDPKTGTGKIYTDHENGFSIDTERALMIEDEKGKKTYTFKIERSTNGALENLVLTETDNGYYDASIIKYAPELLNTKEKLTNEQVKQYITIDYLGKKSSTDIFSKIQTCYATVQQYMFVPGTTCASSDHHQYGDSSCQLTGWQAATPGYWTTSYSFIMYACDDGMPGGSIGTAPIGGGGGAPDVDFTDPCNILKSKIRNAKFKEKVAAIDKPEVFDYDHEMGFAAAYPPPNAGVTGIQYQPMENTLGTHQVKLPDGNQYFGFIHSHNNESGGGHPVKIFSPGDLATFLTSCVANAEISGGIIDAYCMVITSEGNYILQFTGSSSGFGIGPNTVKFWKSWYNREALAIQNDDGTCDQDKVEKMFLRFLKEKVKIDGIELYQIDKITNKAKKLSLDENNNVIPTPCP